MYVLPNKKCKKMHNKSNMLTFIKDMPKFPYMTPFLFILFPYFPPFRGVAIPGVNSRDAIIDNIAS